MKSSVYAVIGAFPSGLRRRLADFETRNEAEEYAGWQQAEQMVAGASFEVKLLDRPLPPAPPVCKTGAGTGWLVTMHGEGEVVKEGCPACLAVMEADMEEKRQLEVRAMLKAALRREPLPSELRRAMAVWNG